MKESKGKRGSDGLISTVDRTLRRAGLVPRQTGSGPGFTIAGAQGACSGVDVTVYRSAPSAARAVRESIAIALTGRAWRLAKQGEPEREEASGLFSCVLHVESARTKRTCAVS